MKKLIKTLLVTLLIIPCMAVMTACSGPAGANGKDGANGINGTNGIHGTNGANGDSAYQVWLDSGHTGSESDFMEWLKGADGTNGAKGDKGEPGTDGAKGDKGDTGEKGADGVKGDDGTDGESAFDLWLKTQSAADYANENDTTVEQLVLNDFLEYLKGDKGKDGTNGESAYQIWLKNNTGTEEDFLNWLKGEDGKEGAKGDDGNDGTNGEPGEPGTDGKSAFELWLETNHAADYAAENNKTVNELVLDDFFEWMISNGNRLVALNIPTFTNGTVTASGAFPAPANTLVTLTVTPAAGHKLLAGSLKVNGTPVTLNGTIYQFYMPNKTANITAEFVAIPMPPSAPQNITAFGGNGFVEITWDAPSGTGGYPITEYQVSTDNATWTTADGETHHKFTNLTNGISYTFYVRANNFDQNGTAGSVTGEPHTTAPSAPQNLAVVAMLDDGFGNGTVDGKITWDAPADDGGDNNIIYWAGTDADFSQATEITNGDFYYNFYNATPGMTKLYVWAVNSTGESEPAAITLERGESYRITVIDTTNDLVYFTSNGGQDYDKGHEYMFERSKVYVGIHENRETIYEYVDNTLTVTGANGEITLLWDAGYNPYYNGGSWYFIMPDCDVTVSAQFNEIAAGKYWGTIELSMEQNIHYLIINDADGIVTMNVQSDYDQETDTPIYSDMELPFTKDGEKYLVVGGNDGQGTLYGGAFEKQQDGGLVMTNMTSYDNGTTWEIDSASKIFFEYNAVNDRYENAVSQESMGMYLTADGEWYMVRDGNGYDMHVAVSGEYTTDGTNVTFTFTERTGNDETELTFTGTTAGGTLTVNFTAVANDIFGDVPLSNPVVVFTMA